MTIFHCHIATSLDGKIARPDGGPGTAERRLKLVRSATVGDAPQLVYDTAASPEPAA